MLLTKRWASDPERAIETEPYPGRLGLCREKFRTLLRFGADGCIMLVHEDLFVLGWQLREKNVGYWFESNFSGTEGRRVYFALSIMHQQGFSRQQRCHHVPVAGVHNR
jgi:hypothetical protein